jgi:SAM-dependent methyltransferase
MAMNDFEQLRAYYQAVLPFYDDSLADRGDLPFWVAVVRDWGAKGVLELGCGTGRVTEVLSRVAPVTAIDVLIELLHRASGRAPGARLVVADLRAFSFRSRFGLMVLADDPMAHVTSTAERERILKLIAEHLLPGGRVVLEGLYLPSKSERVVPARRILRAGRAPFTVEESWKGAPGSMWKATYRFEEGSSIVEATSLVRSWTLDEAGGLSRAGLRIDRLWGDFDRRPFGEESTRIIIVATRE